MTNSRILAGLFAASASAFPFLAEMPDINSNILQTRTDPGPIPNPFIKANAGWSPTQRIDVSGQHAFVAPDFAAGDQRGPCPGLNALANHNYLPHNGVATITQFVDACTTIFGMGTDLALILAVLGAAMDGDGTSWSIGGPAPNSFSILPAGVVGQPQGISGSHNKYEGDSSPTRADLYEYGNDYKVVLSQFQELYNMQAKAANPDYDLLTLGEFRSKRWDESVANNPYFFNGPVTGILVSQAAFTFIPRFFSNKTQENPQGVLSKEVLKSFFSITGDDDNLVYTPGNERIPENWYRRAFGDEYGGPGLNADIVNFVLRYPKIASVGGNTGTTNSFTGVDISDLTGGALNSKTFLEGNNLICFALQAAKQGEPDVTLNVVDTLTKGLGSVIAGLSCPQLSNIDESQFAKYPGSSKLKKGGVY